MIRILHVVSSLKTGGGVQQLLLNYFSNIDRDKILFDFIVHGDQIGGLEKKATELGSSIYHVSPKKESLIKNFMQINKVIKEGKYDVVHCHQDYSNLTSLFIAALHFVPVRISHAHSDFIPKTLIRKKANTILRTLNNGLANYYFACSEKSGLWLHGEKWTQNSINNFLMKNAIDINLFSFSNDIRMAYRSELGLGDKIVLLNVGRFSEEKNQGYLLDLLKVLLENNDKYALLFVGSGHMEPRIKQLAKAKKISDKVIFLGERNDVANLMSASDFFLLPSKHEGFGMTAIEAQISGLKTITSDRVSMETKISKLIKYIPLNDFNGWINMILDNQGYFYNRNEVCDVINVEEYSIHIQAAKYEDLIHSIISRESERRL